MTTTYDFIGTERIERSAHLLTMGRTLTAYLGVCETHQRPVRVELPGEVAQYAMIDCPVGGEPIKAERLVATITRMVCDGSCMGATGPNCDCGCGGYNHGRAFQFGSPVEVLESALAKYRTQRERTERKRQERADKAATQAAKAWDTFAAQHANVVGYLSRLDRATLDTGFLYDMAGMVINRKPLSENMWRAVERIMGRELVKRQQDAERAANAKPVPTGKVRITGKIVKVACVDGWQPGSTELKMTVACDGYAVRVTLPRAIQDWACDAKRDVIFRDLPRVRYGVDYEGTTQRWTEALRDIEVAFTATVEASQRDASFGFGKRPTAVTWAH